MRIRNDSRANASPFPGSNVRNGRPCPRCKRFGTYAPNSIVCDRCIGALPLVFTVTVVVLVGGEW